MYWYLGLETFTWNMIEMFTYDTILAPGNIYLEYNTCAWKYLLRIQYLLARGNIYLEYNTCLQVEMFG